MHRNGDSVLAKYYSIREAFGTSKELTSCTFPVKFRDADDCYYSGINLFDKLKNDVLIKRLDNEVHFHSFMLNQLFSRLQEIKAYSNVDINNTRRLIAVSSDCISTIHILVRDEIQVNVYFRSSDFDGALPCDLKFISEIPSRLIEHMIKFKNTKGYEEVTQELIQEYKEKPVLINIIFGSLHRTKE